MSNIYVQEPPTQGKVLLETSVGDIEIELWSRECPKACRNFVQLCMEGYYNRTKFFRVIKDFIVQGGDPTNSGKGGESIYGGNFKDEFHSRLRFVRRGLVAMANADQKDTNGSQFFFTMGQTPELQNKHTIFGKIAGDTIYNSMKLQEGEIYDEAPARPHKVYRTKVLNNPFSDIVPREGKNKDEKKSSEKKAPESKMKATKDYKLLSFGDEAEEDEEDLEETLKHESKLEGKSSHDLLNDPKLLKEAGSVDLTAEECAEPNEEVTEEALSNIREKLKKRSAGKKVEVNSSDSEDSEDEAQKEKRRKKEEIQKEIKALKKTMRPNKKTEEAEGGSKIDNQEEETEEEKNNELLKDFHRQQKNFAEKQTSVMKKKSSSRQEMTMKMLEKFKNNISHAEEKPLSPENENDDSGWMSHTLKFQHDDPVLAKDASTKDDEWFDIYDPRNPINKRRRGDKSSKRRDK